MCIAPQAPLSQLDRLQREFVSPEQILEEPQHALAGLQYARPTKFFSIYHVLDAPLCILFFSTLFISLLTGSSVDWVFQ